MGDCTDPGGGVISSAREKEQALTRKANTNKTTAGRIRRKVISGKLLSTLWAKAVRFLQGAATLRAKPGGFLFANAPPVGNQGFQVIILPNRLGNRLDGDGRPISTRPGRHPGSIRPAGSDLHFNPLFDIASGCLWLHLVQPAQDIGSSLNQSRALSWVLSLRDLSQGVIEIQLLECPKQAIALSQKGRYFMLLQAYGNRFLFKQRPADVQTHQHQ
jgi:hypothetical protein